MTKLGAYVGFPDMYSASTQAATKARWDFITAEMGQTPTMVLQYVDKEHPRSQWLSDQQWAIGSWKASPWLANAIPVVGLPMAVTKASAVSDFRAIAAGQWDATINGIFKSWSDAGYKTIYLRPGWEMNGDWYAWGITAANAADFAAAFRRIADLAHNYAAAKITVVWNPNVGDPSPQHVPFVNYYPGDAYVDVIGIDSYGAPIDSDTSPDDNPASPSDFTLRAAIDFAKAHGKAFAIPETGGANPAFPANLATEIAARGVAVDFVGIWTMPDEYGWSDGPGDTAAWKAAFQTIGGTVGGPVDPPPPPEVSRQTLTLVLSEDRYRGDAKFAVSLDGAKVGSGTVTALHSQGKTQEFTFSGDWKIGAHDIRIDFLNDAYGGRRSADRNLYVEQVKWNGVGYLDHTQAMMSNGGFVVHVDH